MAAAEERGGCEVTRKPGHISVLKDRYPSKHIVTCTIFSPREAPDKKGRTWFKAETAVSPEAAALIGSVLFFNEANWTDADRAAMRALAKRLRGEE